MSNEQKLPQESFGMIKKLFFLKSVVKCTIHCTCIILFVVILCHPPDIEVKEQDVS